MTEANSSWLPIGVILLLNNFKTYLYGRKWTTNYKALCVFPLISIKYVQWLSPFLSSHRTRINLFLQFLQWQFMFDFDVISEERDFVNLLCEFLIECFFLLFKKLLNILRIL